MAKRTPRYLTKPTTGTLEHDADAERGGEAWSDLQDPRAASDSLNGLPEDDDAPSSGRPSRRQKRQGAEEAMALGHRLVELAGPRREALALPDDVREAVEEALRMRSFAARKRQMLFLGKVLRNCDDLDDIARALDEMSEQDRRGTRAFQRVESWRERLLQEGESALDELCALYPTAGRDELQTLMREAQRGRDNPRGAGAARGLFRLLRALLVHPGAAG